MIYKIKNYDLKIKLFINLFFIVNLNVFFIEINEKKLKIQNKNISNIDELIEKLNLFSSSREPNNYLFSDLFTSKYCYDKNSYYIFDYYLNKNYSAYYLINSESDLYFSLLRQNKTKNLILYKTNENIYNKMFPYLLNAKTIIQSYIIPEIHLIVSKVPYIKFLRVNHGVRYFKPTNFECPILSREKRNTIASSPIESKLLYGNYKKDQIFNAGLARWERFNYKKKKKSEKSCILMSFTRREYSNDIFQKSLYKKNLEKFFNNTNFIEYIKRSNIELIYIPHHRELFLQKNYTQNMFKSAILGKQNKLEYYIEQCSLLITDFSSICFDFFFQNKPVLFYSIDFNDSLKFSEKYLFKKKNDFIFFGNAFEEQELLIKKIKYYIERNFQIEPEIKYKYNSLFFCKKNIIQKISNAIEKIISES